ncbi:MAG: hypothetical protein A2010_07725 [Nitrospirae bacterium GWD2_57_9]|nr:MAG: hypothetical protein A2010_07725 [Nitrospirae bacterium GWD2_57_9]OGW49262.1 MAG: hypothetical protein A2078_07785 [Nitrospirae bacterium GWC2_57_9]
MDEDTRFLILSLDGDSYALPISRLQEITVPRDIHKDDGLSTLFEGAVEYRGRPIPVLNPKKVLNLAGKPGGVLLVVKGAKGPLGVLADEVREIIESNQKPAPVPAGVMDRGIRVFRGLIRHKGELILLLNEDGLVQ